MAQGGRLSIAQVRAPDLSGTSDILRNAGAAFDRGLDSAQGMLGKYQEGQTAKADAALTAEISKISDEAGLD